MVRAVVIGGGQAGLAATYHLARHGIEHVVLERGRVGESWRSQRWDSFVLNTPNWMSHLPGKADETEPRDAFLTRDAFVARLQTYADDRQIPVRTGVEVTAVCPRPAGDGFVVSADDGGNTVDVETENVIVASGVQRIPKVFEWLVGAGFFEVLLDKLSDPRMRFAKQPAISGVGAQGHTVSLQYLAERGAVLLGRPSGVEGDRVLLDDTLGANIAFGDRMSAEANRGLEEGIRNAGLEPPDLEPDPADAPHPDPMSVRSPSELDLEAAGVGSVVWATGFGGDFGYLKAPVVDDGGEPIHQRGVSPVPGIYFLGFPWLSKRKSGIIYGIDEDAAFIADHVAERLAATDSPG